MNVKICGITTLEDALMAAKSGADLLGLNCYKKSPRYIAPDDARALCDALRAALGDACPLLVGVFVNEVVGVISATTRKIGLDAAQLSGDESDSLIRELRGIGFKAIRPLNPAQALDDLGYFQATMPDDERLPSLLLDAHDTKLYGGTGKTAGIEIALELKSRVPRLMLAGGLTPDNVAGIVAQVAPWGVDTASGVEGDTPGKKDPGKVRAFIQAVRG